MLWGQGLHQNLRNFWQCWTCQGSGYVRLSDDIEQSVCPSCGGHGLNFLKTFVLAVLIMGGSLVWLTSFVHSVMTPTAQEAVVKPPAALKGVKPSPPAPIINPAIKPASVKGS